MSAIHTLSNILGIVLPKETLDTSCLGSDFIKNVLHQLGNLSLKDNYQANEYHEYIYYGISNAVFSMVVTPYTLYILYEL